MDQRAELETVAAVDLGSNSSHRQARRVERTALVLLERVRDERGLDGGAPERALT